MRRRPQWTSSRIFRRLRQGPVRRSRLHQRLLALGQEQRRALCRLKERLDRADGTVAFTYSRASHRAGLGWMGRDRVVRLPLGRACLPTQSQRSALGTSGPDPLTFRQRCSLPRRCPSLQLPRPLAGEICPSNGPVVYLHWPCSLLRRGQPLRYEGPVAEANLAS